MNDVVHKLGKTTVAWDDAAVGIDNQNTVLMWWHDKHPEKMLQNDYQVVLCPHVVTYFNSRQEASHQVLKNRPCDGSCGRLQVSRVDDEGDSPCGERG